MNYYKSKYTGTQIDNLLDKVEEDLVSPATLTNKVEANAAAVEQEVTDRKKAVSDLNSALTAELNNKVSKVPGKGLSTNDYTDDDKAEVTKIKDKADQITLDEKQDTLVSGENIKTINGTSLLGSGDYAFDSAFDETSTNAVENQVISKEVKELNYEIAVLKEAVFEVVLSEIDYTSVFTDSFVIPETLTDTDGTHRVVFNETELKKVAGNSVVWNQFCNFDFIGTSYADGAIAKGQNIKIAVKNGYAIGQSLTHLQEPIPTGHKVFYMLNKRSGETATGATEIGGYHLTPLPHSWQGSLSLNSSNKVIFTTTDTATDILLFLHNGTNVTEEVDADFYYTDLTQMFGAGNEPTSVDDVRIQWLIKYLENNPDYDTGTIKSSIINGLQSLDSNDEVIGSISIPTTEIKSAGTAQDYIEVVDGDIVEGEQLYNLVKITNIGSVDLGTLNWMQTAHNCFWAYIDDMLIYNAKAICSKYSMKSMALLWTEAEDKVASTNTNYLDTSNWNKRIVVRDTSYASISAFKSAMSGVPLYYQLATPTQTTIATNLHFSEISMLIAEGGKIKPLYDNVPVDTTLTFVVKKAISE
jgi:hypothetical protein